MLPKQQPATRKSRHALTWCGAWICGLHAWRCEQIRYGRTHLGYHCVICTVNKSCKAVVAQGYMCEAVIDSSMCKWNTWITLTWSHWIRLLQCERDASVINLGECNFPKFRLIIMNIVYSYSTIDLVPPLLRKRNPLILTLCLRTSWGCAPNWSHKWVNGVSGNLHHHVFLQYSWKECTGSDCHTFNQQRRHLGVLLWWMENYLWIIQRNEAHLNALL